MALSHSLLARTRLPPALRPQHIPPHLAVVETVKRHIGIVAQWAGGEASFKLVQYVSGHRVHVGERLRPDLAPPQFTELRIRMDDAFDTMGDRGGVSGEEPRVETPDTAGRGDCARDQKQARGVRKQASFGK